MSCGDCKELSLRDRVDGVAPTELFPSAAKLPLTGWDEFVRVKRARVWTPGLGAIAPSEILIAF